MADGSWGVLSYRGCGSWQSDVLRSDPFWLTPRADGQIAVQLGSGRAVARFPWDWAALVFPPERLGVEIPGFSDYTLDRAESGLWGVRSYRLGRKDHRPPGEFMDPHPPGKFSLRPDGGGQATRTLSTWMTLAGIGVPDRCGFPLRGFSDYTVDRKPDGEWGVRLWRSPVGTCGGGRDGRKPGDFVRVDRAKNVKLRSDDGKWVDRRMRSWLILAGCVDREGTTIPGFTSYTLDRRPDGRWGVRSYRPGRGANRPYGGFLEPHVNADGREHYTLVDVRGGSRHMQVARLILLTFVGPPPETYMYCCHRDDVCTNNEVENLYWGTSKRNGEDRVRNGKSRPGESHPHAKLTADALPIVRLMAAQGISQEVIGNVFGVSQSAISRVLLGRTWSNPTPAAEDATI